MTLGALISPAALVFLATVDTLAGFYFSWAAIGASHALVLYEPAFARSRYPWQPQSPSRPSSCFGSSCSGASFFSGEGSFAAYHG